MSTLALSLVDAAKSNPGLYAQATAALIFQLVGVVLVVDDVRSARRRLNSLYSRFDEIDTAAKLAIKRRDLEVYTESGELRQDVDFSTLFATPFMTVQEVMGSLSEKTKALAEQHDRFHNRWATWIGPVSLLLGIVFSFTAAISSVK
jgi:hypothetical protein